MSLKVVVSGAGGKMGREVARAVYGAEDMELVGAADPMCPGEDLGEVAGLGTLDIPISDSIEKALAETDAEYVVDFTTPDVVFANVTKSLELGRSVVFGTTGLTEDDLSEIDRRAKEADLGVVHAPNFAVGAVLMMRFAAEASRFFDEVEIIELHHDQKKDAPSGTAIKTAELIAEARAGDNKESATSEEVEVVEGARGGRVRGVPVHSVRLPGLVAHQEVLLGLAGQTLTIRHDSIDRVSFMPGVLLALRRVGKVRGLVYGLEHLLFEE